MKFIVFIIALTLFTISSYSQYGHWEKLNPAVSPPVRVGFGMANLKDNIVMIFGGDGEKSFLDDTWIFDLTKNTWVEVKSTVHPSKRYLPAMAKIADGKVLLFSGDAGVNQTNDTWLFDYNTLQ